MKGAVAAGHPLTAEAGARILAEGGNAVDACIAAAFVSWVAESPLTGPGGGGFMLVHGGRDRTVPASISRDYAERALAAGDDVELVIDSRSGHFEHLDPSSELWRAVRDWLDRRFA